MENFKPRLFFFGDSFIQWNLPNPGHWTERFCNEYDVYRLGSSGASNEAILTQLGVLPPFRDGDRIVVSLTEPSRLSKWMYLEEYPNWVKNKDILIQGNYEERDFTYSIYRVRERKYELLNENVNFLVQPRHSYIDNPIQTLNMFGFLYKALQHYKPVYITWCPEMVKMEPISHIITRISFKDYTDIGQESNSNVEDYHPGLEGGKVWHKRVKKLLEEWKPLDFEPKSVGSSYFDSKADYIENKRKINYNIANLIKYKL
jgi:hypothetical protein